MCGGEGPQEKPFRLAISSTGVWGWGGGGAIGQGRNGRRQKLMTTDSVRWSAMAPIKKEKPQSDSTVGVTGDHSKLPSLEP